MQPVPAAPVSGPEVVTRPQAIHDLRSALAALTDREHSLCQVAAERKVFCRGFSSWSEVEVRRRFQQVLENQPRPSRKELEEIVNTYQLMRQYIDGARLPCDVEEVDHELCLGWDGFSNDQLGRYCLEILGRRVEVVEPRAFSKEAARA